MNQNELKLWYLKNVKLFKDMKEEELKKFNEKMYMKDYQKKEYIYLSPEHINHVYLIKHGNVEIGYLDESGREFALDILGPGELFGAVLGKGHRGGYARAVNRAIICVLDRQEFEDFLAKNPEFSIRIMKFLGFKITALENKLQNLVFKDVKTRICELLSSLYEKVGDKQSGMIRVPLTHQDIANLVGSTRETASVYLSELKKEGIIDYVRKKVRVLAPQKLKLYSQQGASV